MTTRFVLDPVSGIPQPPDDESKVLQWARDLTESLQRDHVANVDRTENLVMMEHRLTKRPLPTGSRRFYYDQYTDILWLDVENSSGVGVWQPINSTVSYESDGLGVHVFYSTSLPYAAGTSGTFSFDDEGWDADSYWSAGDPTVITIPANNTYQITFVAKITALATSDELNVFSLHGDSSNYLKENKFDHIKSAGSGNEYELKISYIDTLAAADEITFQWVGMGSFTLSECYCIVTPVTSGTGGGGVVPTITAHDELTGLLSDDHTQYILGARADWTDLTDGGETSLHTHGNSTICLDIGAAFQCKDSSSTCQNIGSISSDNVHLANVYLDTFLYGLTIDIGSSGTLNIDSSGAMSISNIYSGDITIDSTEFLNLAADDGIRIRDNNYALCGRVSGSATYHDMIKVNSDNRTEVGNESLNTWINTYLALRLGRYESTIYMEDSGGAWKKVFQYNGSIFEVGNIGDEVNYFGSSIDIRSNSGAVLVDAGTAFIVDASTSASLSASQDITLDAGDDLILGSDDETYIYGGDSVRYSYTDTGGNAPTAANMDLTSGTWGIAYDGTNYYFGALTGTTFSSAIIV